MRRVRSGIYIACMTVGHAATNTTSYSYNYKRLPSVKAPDKRVEMRMRRGKSCTAILASLFFFSTLTHSMVLLV